MGDPSEVTAAPVAGDFVLLGGPRACPLGPRGSPRLGSACAVLCGWQTAWRSLSTAAASGAQATVARTPGDSWPVTFGCEWWECVLLPVVVTTARDRRCPGAVARMVAVGSSVWAISFLCHVGAPLGQVGRRPDCSSFWLGH